MKHYVEWILRHRLLVVGLVGLVTVALALQISQLHVIIDPNTMLPQDHPFVVATNRVEKLFGSKYIVIIGVTPKQGDAFSAHVLRTVQRLTTAILEAPGIVKENVLSLSSRRAKNIVGMADGIDVRQLMEAVPATPAEAEVLRGAVRANPVYVGTLVSRDESTVAIIAEFREQAGGFRAIVENLRPIVERERDGSVDISLGGLPVFLAEIEIYSQRIAFLFFIAVLIAGLIHYEAFRTVQGLILPLVTALLAVLWGLGIMRLAGIPMDVFNGTTPILILAIAAGHAVQILKRYYEEYHRLRQTTDLAPAEASRAAVVESVTRIGPVMLTAGSVAVLGFFSLAVFEITTIRTFGVFTGLGILSAVILEMTFIPALRSLLPAPGRRESHRERERCMWDRLTERIADWVIGPGRWRIYAGVALLVLFCGSGLSRLAMDNSVKSYFFDHLPFQRDDRALNERLAGTNTLYVLVEAQGEDAIKDPKLLRAMEATQRFLEQQPNVGKTLSLADFVKRMNRAMHGNDAAFNRIPESRELISQYLLLYSMSGEPGDFDTYVDYAYRSANIWVFLKSDSSAFVQGLIARLNDFTRAQFGDRVRISMGGSVAQTAALNEVMVRDKILNIIQIGGVVLLIASVVFRSLWAGLLVLVPLLLAVLANFGLMGWLGIRLNIGTSLISAMAVGIGADYAIYLIYRLREELGRSVDESVAFRAALTTAGKAILFVASAVAGGYGVLLFSYGYYIHMWFAILIATAMLVSSLAALTILPCLILTLRPRFVFGAARPRRVPARGITAALLLAIGLASLSGNPASADPLTATEIMQKNFVAAKVVDSISDVTFTLTSKTRQERVRKTVVVTKLQPNGVDNMQMMRFLSPPDDKGTAVLTIEHGDKDDDIWVYLPALKKVRRLVASNKKSSFAGTDFSYGDVIGHKVEEWEHRLLGEEELDGRPCYVIESLPASDTVKSNSGYSKHRLWIRKDNFVAIKEEFWDQAGQPLKTFRGSDVRLVDPGRKKWRAMRLEASNIQTGHRTTIQFENFKTNQQVKDEFFTTRYMEREP
ncbi:MAG: outer membrane lipoprotein-sorting protein [Deltaproteobacteria bacterium]|nr:outer membrane lipoprotein-sorting protein [Deltaproteobacteria bacterium]